MSEDATLVIRVQIAPEDVTAFEKSIVDAEGKKIGIKLIALPAAPLIFVAMVPVPFWLSATFGIGYEIGAIASILVIGIVIAITLKGYNSLLLPERHDPESKLWGSQDFTFSGDGVHIETAYSRTSLGWNAFVKARDTSEHIFLFVDARMAHIVPKRALSLEALEKLLRALRSHMKLETR